MRACRESCGANERTEGLTIVRCALCASVRAAPGEASHDAWPVAHDAVTARCGEDWGREGVCHFGDWGLYKRISARPVEPLTHATRKLVGDVAFYKSACVASARSGVAHLTLPSVRWALHNPRVVPSAYIIVSSASWYAFLIAVPFRRVCCSCDSRHCAHCRADALAAPYRRCCRRRINSVPADISWQCSS